MPRPNLDVSEADRDTIVKIAERFTAYMKQHHPKMKVLRPDLDMDIAATHLNGCELNLQELLEFPDFSLIHDVTGIVRHLDRRTGALKNSFRPRCAKDVVEKVTEQLTK